MKKLLFVLLLLTVPAQGTQITVTANTTDVFLHSGDGNNYGYKTSTTIGVYNDGSTILTSIYFFDLSGIPANNSIVGCTFSNYIRTVNGKGNNVSFFRIASGNSKAFDGQACWNYAYYNTVNWAGSVGCRTSGTDFVASAIGTTTVPAAASFIWVPFDLTQSNTMLGANYGIVEIINTGQTTTQMYGDSADYATADNRPHLIIDYLSNTPTNTPTTATSDTYTQTPTATYTDTRTATATPTRTATVTETGTDTDTATETATYTETATVTKTDTNTKTATRTATNTRTVTISATPTRTRTGSRTATPAGSATRTFTPTSTAVIITVMTPTRTPTAYTYTGWRYMLGNAQSCRDPQNARNYSTITTPTAGTVTYSTLLGPSLAPGCVFKVVSYATATWQLTTGDNNNWGSSKSLNFFYKGTGSTPVFMVRVNGFLGSQGVYYQNITPTANWQFKTILLTDMVDNCTGCIPGTFFDDIDSVWFELKSSGTLYLDEISISN